MFFRIEIFVFVLFNLTSVFGANILYIEPLPSPSHHIWNKRLSLALSEKGHNVTAITHDFDKPPLPKNYTSILLEGIYELMHKEVNVMEIVQDTDPFNIINEMAHYSLWTCEHDFKTKGLQTLLDYPDDFFDLIIYDTSILKCFHPLIEKFNFPPIVGVSPFLLPPYLSYEFGNDLYTSYIPFFGAPFTDKMSFKERFLNMMYVYYMVYHWEGAFFKDQEEMPKKRFGNVKSLGEIDDHINILLSNTDPILDYPQPLPPNIIPVGGLHAVPSKKLPQDLEKIVSEAKHGFIIFSLGTNIRSDQIGETRLRALLGTFKKLQQTVLWKYESDNLKDVPKNVIIRKWLPINDLLGHPNIKLFITHGGALSTQETMYHGVPVVGIPVFADQIVNLKKMETKKLGTTVDFRDLNEKNLYAAITEVLNNPIYTTNIKDLSKKYRDQPQTPLERAVFYVEYMLRHKDGQFPNIAARHMPFYRRNNLDIFAALFIIVTIVAVTSCKILKTAARLLGFGNKKKIKTN